MELRDYLRILLKNWVLIALITLVGAAGGWAYATLATPVYTASAKVFVSTTGAASTSELAQGNSFTLQRVQTYSDLVKTSAVIEPTIEALGLDASVPEIRSRVSASSPQNTTIIDVTASGADAESAAALATETARQLVTVVESWERTEGMAASPVALKIAQEAEPASAPTSPNLIFNVAIGTLLGLCLGIAAALLRSVLDTKVHTERDVRRVAQAPIIGSIPFDPHARTRPLIVHEDRLSVHAESFRSLRTNLQFLGAGQDSQSLVLTSSVPGEGKSTTAANLAIALADAHQRVLLVEADLRRPKIGDYLGIESAAGLTDVLIGRIEIDDAIQPWGDSGLEVLSAGQIPPNPSELLGSPTMAEVVAELDRRYDVVLYDAPPLLPVTDAAVLAQHVGATVIVVAVGRAHVPEVRSALEAADQVGVPASGIILSMVPTSGVDAYSYRRYGYTYTKAEETKGGLFRRLMPSGPAAEGEVAPHPESAPAEAEPASGTLAAEEPGSEPADAETRDTDEAETVLDELADDAETDELVDDEDEDGTDPSDSDVDEGERFTAPSRPSSPARPIGNKRPVG